MKAILNILLIGLLLHLASPVSAEILYGVANGDAKASGEAGVSNDGMGDVASAASKGNTTSTAPALLPMLGALAAILAINPDISSHGVGGKHDEISSASPDNVGLNLGSVELCEETEEHTLSMQGPSSKGCYDRMDKNFATFFKREFVKCIKEVVPSNGRSRRNIVIQHMGIFVPRNARNTNVLSTHAAGRAIDISKIVVDGKPFSMHQKNHDRRYDKLRRCWQRKGREFAKEQGISARRCAINSIGHPHSHPPSNSLHHDHLHVSFNCPRLRGYAKY